jgi:GT2 family glycosyltransferase
LNTEPNVDISVITVTYNSEACIGECLRSVREQQEIRAEIIVVDNASSDGTVQLIQRMPKEVKLLANRENLGFAQGCNQGARASRGRLLFMLNPDARLEQSDGLIYLCRAMQENSGWGLAGTRIIRPDGRVENPGEKEYPEQRRVRCDFSHLPGSIAWVLGASIVVRRGPFASVGGFDPAFFLYYEETDLCLRLRQHGWGIGFIPDVAVRHIGGASEQNSDPYSVCLRRMSGLHRFWAKHYPPRDVRRMVRLDWFRASFRSRWYSVIAPLHGTGSRAWLKQREYRAIREASRRFLRPGAVDAA